MAIPNVLGQPIASARDALRSAGLKWVEQVRSTTDIAEDGRVIQTEPQWGADVHIGSTVSLTVGSTPTWHVVYRFSGEDSRQSPPLELPAKWRIRYSIVGQLAQAIVTWRASDGFEDSTEISPYGDGLIDTSAGVGTYAIIIEPTGYAAEYGRVKWAVSVEAFE